MKTSSACFQTGRPLRALFLASSSLPKKLFLLAFLFGFVSTVFFVRLGTLCWTFEQAGPSTSLLVADSAVQMPCQSSVRVDFNDRIENVDLISFFSTNRIDYTKTSETLLVQYISNHINFTKRPRRFIRVSFTRQLFIIIKVYVCNCNLIQKLSWCDDRV